MSEVLCILLFFAAQMFGVLFVTSEAKKNDFCISAAYKAWMFLLPVFGSVMMLQIIRAKDQPRKDSVRLTDNSGTHRQLMSTRFDAAHTVPLEEALLINEPNKRRTLMLSLLRSDPKKYLDVLLIARFNDDPETTHYAVATLTEIQNQFQVSLQDYQKTIKEHPGDLDSLAKYIHLLQEYCASGLLEGQVLKRQRMLLADALKAYMLLDENVEFMVLDVKNNLDLEDESSARKTARKLWARYPGDERS